MIEDCGAAGGGGASPVNFLMKFVEERWGAAEDADRQEGVEDCHDRKCWGRTVRGTGRGGSC